MKILQVLPTLSAGGAESFITGLGCAHAELGAEVRFFLLAGVRGARGQLLLSRLQRAGIETVGAEERSPRAWSNIPRLSRIIRAWRPDVLQANLFSSEATCVAAGFFLGGRRPCYVRRLAGTNICATRSPRLIRAVASHFDLTVACSAEVAAAWEALTEGKVKAPSITIRNGVVTAVSCPVDHEKRAARIALSLPQNGFIVGHVGRMLGKVGRLSLLDEPKAQDVLVKAFALAFGGDPSARLALVGDGPLRPHIESLAQELGIASQVHFLGQQAEAWEALRAFDVFGFPSRNEGMPNALVEAASCGLPVVASNIPEIANLYSGSSWVLAPVDDVEAFAADLREVRRDFSRFSANAREAAAHFRDQFSMRQCAHSYLEAYQQCQTHQQARKVS